MLCVAAWVWFCLSTEVGVVPLVGRDIRVTPKARAKAAQVQAEVSFVGLYKILFHFKALLWGVHHSCMPPPLFAKSTLLHYYCTTIAQYTSPHRPLLFMPYTIQYW